MPGYENLYRTLGIRPQVQAALPVEGDEDLAGMLSDSDITDMQDADLNGQAAFNAKLPENPITHEARGVTSLKSAYDTKQQGMSALRRTLGGDRLKARNAMAVNDASAHNAMALEGMREGSAERIAAKNAETQNARISQQQSYQSEQNALGRDAVDKRMAAGRQATNSRAAGTQAGQNARLVRQQNETRAKALEAQAAKIGPLGGLLGRKDKLLKQASELRKQALSQRESDPEVEAAASDFRQAYPDAQADQLMGILQQTQPGVSPEDLQALYEAILAGQ